MESIETVRRDLVSGVPWQELVNLQFVLGVVGDESVLLIHAAGEAFAIAANCTHYGAPLASGLVVDDTIRCPLHHACFSLRTGAALRAPALDGLARWRVEIQHDIVYVREKLGAKSRNESVVETAGPSSIVIVGGGAAGLAAANQVRIGGYAGPLTIVSADMDPPCDRPNLSKGFLTGDIPLNWIALRESSYYAEKGIDLQLDQHVTSFDPERKTICMANGPTIGYGTLLLATGSAPVRVPVEGERPGQILTLRSFADARAILRVAKAARRTVVVGASFIGLEVAASLRQRGLEVHVVEREAQPMQRILGSYVGRFIRALHERRGVVFHLRTTLARLDGSAAWLSDGTKLKADLVVMGVGVRPSVSLAEQAGLAVDNGVLVDEYLKTSARDVYAAGDIARWPDRRTGERLRVEHWVLAQRQGQVAAMNMLGHSQAFDAVPFFWSQHYETVFSYIGHAARWDTVDVDGSLEAGDCKLTYRLNGRALAVVTVGRDRQNLEAELAMEREHGAHAARQVEARSVE